MKERLEDLADLRVLRVVDAAAEVTGNGVGDEQDDVFDPAEDLQPVLAVLEGREMNLALSPWLPDGVLRLDDEDAVDVRAHCPEARLDRLIGPVLGGDDHD